MKFVPFLLITFLLPQICFSQLPDHPFTRSEILRALADSLRLEYQAKKEVAVRWADRSGFPIRQVFEDGTVIEIQWLSERGIPVYYTTDNLNAAQTVSTDLVWPGGGLGLSLDGDGIVIGEWDGGKVLDTHQELTGRVTQMDGVTTLNDHATHVAGTMIATGVVSSAHGMADAAEIEAYNYNNDESEMADAAADNLILSNHSYGIICGWDSYGWDWYGDPAIDPDEDYKFGFYMDISANWDLIAFNAPYYLIMKSAGNDRGHVPFPTRGPPPPADADNDGGYDTIGPQGVAKNILTVGAIDDIPAHYSDPADVVMTSFSSWGPADDGRIKPDIVANGNNLYSSVSGSDATYDTYSGTSMATPNATGSLALLQQHYYALSGGYYMRSATLKGLVIHTADEAGTYDGPDYRFGWGLLNTASAATLISEVWESQENHTIKERLLTDGNSYSITVTSEGSAPLRATLCWTDPPGVPVADALDPTDPMLINDLDLRITRSGSTCYPWTLDPSDPDAAATADQDNSLDNVERIDIDEPAAGDYTITVSHKGTLDGGQQYFSLLMSGAWYSDQSLPVTLIAFKGKSTDKGILLEWETASEYQNIGFVLKRSASGDGPYTEIASYKTEPGLAGSGSSSEGAHYAFLDTTLVSDGTYRYQLIDVAYDGKTTSHGTVHVTYKNHSEQPASFTVYQNSPNPFNDRTMIRYSLSSGSDVALHVYDVRGQQVQTLVSGHRAPGDHTVYWRADGVAAGIYIYTLTVKKEGRKTDTISRKMVLTK